MSVYPAGLPDWPHTASTPQPPLQRGGEGLITVLSRNWSIFNSSGELTGTSTQWHVLSGLKPAWVVVVADVTNSLFPPNLNLTAAGGICNVYYRHHFGRLKSLLVCLWIIDTELCKRHNTHIYLDQNSVPHHADDKKKIPNIDWNPLEIIPHHLIRGLSEPWCAVWSAGIREL